MSNNQNLDYDVIVVGGGLAGLAFANLLVSGKASSVPAMRVAIIEAAPPVPVQSDAEMDLRVVALSPASRSVLAAAGAWAELPADRLSAYQNMRVWQGSDGPDGNHSINFAAAELGVAELGYIVESNLVRRILWQLAVSAGVDFYTECNPVGLSITEKAGLIELPDRTLTGRLVVGADGADSWVRKQLAVEYRDQPYGQRAIVAHLASELPHQQTAWQHFLPGGPVALLPLADGRTSLVWSCPDAEADRLLQLDATQFAQELGGAVNHVLGAMECTTERVSFPLAMGCAKNVSGPRYALIGDAAHRVHPLAGQGINLGFLDAAVLAEEILQHHALPLADPGDAQMLRRFARRRAGDNRLTMGAMDTLNTLFGRFGSLAGTGMNLINRAGPLKAVFARYAMGVDRDLPSLARSSRISPGQG